MDEDQEEVVLVASGELDLAVVTRYESVVEDVVGRVGVVDVTAVEFMDSTGVHLLLRLLRATPHATLLVRGAPVGGPVHRVLATLGLQDLFTFAD